jgi:hypothetical protein
MWWPKSEADSELDAVARLETRSELVLEDMLMNLLLAKRGATIEECPRIEVERAA